MIYIFDKTQAIIKVLTNDDFTAAHLNFKINTATTFEFSLPASKALPSGSKYVATPHPLNDSKFIMLRLTERVDNTETIDYSAYELAYQELATDGYIEDKRPQNQSALNLMKIALDGSNWELNNVNVSGTATTNFYYIDRLSAISKVVDLLGGEIVFYIEIQGNAISGRYMDYLSRQGSDTSKVFAIGSNLLTVERQSDTSGIYTAILPRGKGKEIDNGDADTPDGYGRRINISDVEWKKSSGNPLDKPKGSIVLSDPDATAEWGQINGNARLLLQTYDDIDDVNVLINSAYKTLQSVNHPQIQYSATVADVGGLSLGDTVLIMHGDRDLSYKTRVFEVKYDLLEPDKTELSLGDDLSSNSITSQINSLNAVADTTSSQTQWTINQIGRPGTTYGETAPDSPKVGDIWFKYLPDGGTEIYRWNGDIWELLVSPTTADDIADAVDDAVAQANAHTDEVKQGLSSDIDTAKSQAASQANAAEANAKSAATSQFMQAQDALTAAKNNLQNDIDKNKGNIVEINQTLTGFDGTLQRVQDSVNNLGQTNQLMNTEFTPDLQGWNDQTLAKTGVGTFNGSNILDLSANSDFRQLFIPLNGATIISASVYRKISISGGSGGRWSLMFYDANNGFISSVFGTYQTSLPDFTLEKLENISVPSGAQSVSLRFYSAGVVSIHQIVQPMLVFEGTVGTYVQGNYNNNDALAQVKLTADQAKLDLSTYKQDADGRISKAQTDITATANQVGTKVSQTDYDTKTGQLTTSVSKAQQTADAVTTSLASYKQDADGRISANSADIITNANAIKQKVAQSDYDANNTKLTSRLTTVETTANGTATTVSDLKQAVNNLGQVNQLFNTEFSPDLQGWRSENANDYLTYLDYSGVYNMSHVLHYNGGKSTRIDIQSQMISISDPNQAFSLSILVKGSVGIAVSGFKSDDESGTGSSYVSLSPQSSSYGDWTLLEFNNRKITSGSSGTAKYISLTFTSTGSEFWVSQPMLVFSSTVGTYVTGAYNNNAALAQVKITADSISNFVRDSSGNISSDFQTALSKTSIITGSTLATSIQQQTATQITSALTDNNGKIISLINQDASGVQIAGKQLILDGPTTVTSDFYAKGGNFKNLNASNITVGTLNGNQVNITNINASNIVTGALTGITLMSSANGSQFKVQGNNLQMIKQNGDNLQLSTDGLFWKDSSGNVLFEASNKLMTSDIFGTAEYNVYLASSNETRSVTYKTALTGSGGVSDYVYVPHRAGGLYANWLEVNAAGSAQNIYIRPLKAESEVRITASGGTDSYANLRARYVFADRIANNSFTNSNHLYLQTNDEVRVKTTNDDVANSGYQAIRASAFNSASLAKYKQNIEVSSLSGLDEINKSIIYNYQLKTSPDKQEVGLVIGDGYDISQVVVDGDGVNQYRMVALAWKAIQELTQQVNELKQELERKVA